jgi:hypothetical protein
LDYIWNSSRISNESVCRVFKVKVAYESSV